jgi:hypothetical protein
MSNTIDITNEIAAARLILGERQPGADRVWLKVEEPKRNQKTPTETLGENALRAKAFRQQPHVGGTLGLSVAITGKCCTHAQAK